MKAAPGLLLITFSLICAGEAQQPPPPAASPKPVAATPSPASAPAATPAATPAVVPRATPAVAPRATPTVAPQATPPVAPKATPPPAPATPPPAAKKEVKQAPALISSDLGGKEMLFLQSAYELGRTQSWLGGLALSKGGSEQVKAIGEALSGMQADEEKYLTRLAERKGVKLDATSTPAPQKKIAAALKKLSGLKFEKAIVEQMVEINHKAVQVYEAALQTTDPEIKLFVEQMLPMAKEKLQFAQKMSGAAPKTGAKPAFR